MTQDDLADHARVILQANLYLTLGTVGADGRPWTAPVYFAPAGDREFVWVSMTNARHSEHLAERPDVSVVVFRSFGGSGLEGAGHRGCPRGGGGLVSADKHCDPAHRPHRPHHLIPLDLAPRQV